MKDKPYSVLRHRATHYVVDNAAQKVIAECDTVLAAVNIVFALNEEHERWATEYARTKEQAREGAAMLAELESDEEGL